VACSRVKFIIIIIIIIITIIMFQEQIVVVLATCFIFRKCFSVAVQCTYLLKRVTAAPNHVILLTELENMFPGLYTLKSPDVTLFK